MHNRHRPFFKHPLTALALLVGVSGLAGAQPSQAPSPSPPAAPAAPAERPCLPEHPAGARCFIGEDGAGSHYWIALPKDWKPETGTLVMHAHGGPADTGPARADRAEEDAKRWAVTVRAGHAWAASTFRRGGYGVTMAAEDTERLRQIVVRHFGQPRRTLLHGQSYGAGVAAKAAELYPVRPGERTDAAAGGARPRYDGVLLTSGVLGGGVRAYEFRLDLRVIYQHLCANHPLPSEPQYPLWQGLPEGSALTRAQLAQRVDECLGLKLPAAQRSPQQQQRVATITQVLKIPESSIQGHLNWATWLFRDVTQLRLGGRNPWSNVGARYQGSADDAALNQSVLRYAADPAAVAQLSQDSEPSGQLTMPVLAVRGTRDAVAFVELQALYREQVERAGQGARLAEAFADESEHSFMSAALYVAAFEALGAWVERAQDKPTPEQLLARCRQHEAAHGGACKVLPDYRPGALDSRVASRPR